MKFARRLYLTVFALHLIAAVVSFMGMDAGLGTPALDRVCNAVIDGYEAVGFGIYPLGIAIVTAVLVIVFFVSGLGLRERARGRSLPKSR